MRTLFQYINLRSCITVLLAIISLMVLPVPGIGQHYHFKNYSVEEGLAQSQLYMIFQCSRGYLWIGTYGGGMSRFDGKNFTNYSTKDGLSDNVVYSMAEDPDGNLWIGTDLGLNKYDGTSFTVYTEKDGLAQNSVRVISRDSKGCLWLGTFSGGLSRFDVANNRFTTFTTADGLANDKVRDVLEDTQGNIWIATFNGINIYDGTRLSCPPIGERLKDHTVFSILEDRKGNMWFATDKGVYCYNGKTFTVYTTREGLAGNYVRDMVEDHNGHFWFATSSGVSQFDGHTFSSYTSQQGLCHNEVYMIVEDRENRLWFATDSGISQFRGKAFSYITAADGLKDNITWGMYEDRDGALWLSTEKGVAKYYEKNSSLVNIPNVWGGDDVAYPLYGDKKGNLWFGSGKTIIKYDGKTFTDLNKKYGLDTFNVFSICEDIEGNFWFGTNGDGVRKYDGKTFTSITKEDGLLDNTVSGIIQDHQGNIWFGTNEGISIYTPKNKEFINITTDQWLTNRYVHMILEDRDHNLWIGTYGGGVIKYTLSPDIGKGKTEVFSTRHGLVDDEVLLMIFDDNGNLWIGTNKGITLLDVGEFNRTGRKVFKYYGKDDGFVGIECNQNAVYKDSRGIIWFGTIRGAIRFDPAEDTPNTVEPVVHITNVKLFFEEVDLFAYAADKDISSSFPYNAALPGYLDLPHHRNHLTFEFIGISLTAPEKVKYRVKLEGFDDNWSPPSAANFATYSNLPPGDYAFKVKACNNSGIWNKSPAVYRFHIHTPYWMTWWFYGLVLIGAIGLIVGFMRIRYRQLRNHQHMLEEQVRLRTRELQEEKQKVEQINQGLEQRVEERTRKLASVNKRLIHAQKMEAVGTLAGGVAHDLNNVLAGIVSYPELLLLELPTDSPLKSQLTTIQRSGEKAAAIVQDLLTLARRGITVTEAVNLNQVVREFRESPEFSKIIDHHPGVKVEICLDERLKNILGSPVHLSKTLMNLISNAAEAMPDGGTVVVTTGNRCVDDSQVNQPINAFSEVNAGEYAVLKVSDNGIGISAEDTERIFEPFYTKKKMGRSGTGLGMAVVWGTVQDHNGFITVQSTEGQGTTFSLFFPVTDREPVRTETCFSINQLMGSGETVLVVDDVLEQREITSLMLNRLDYSVHVAASGEEAIEFVKKHPVDILVLDMIMEPGISGLETYKRILQIYPRQKAILISGYSETDDVREAQRLGAGAYVRKPFGMEKIGTALKKQLLVPGIVEAIKN